MQQAARRQRRGADVFHSAFHELVHHRLIVFGPGVGHAEAIGKISQHVARMRERRRDAVALAARHDVIHRNVVPGLFASSNSPATTEIRYVETGCDWRHVQVFIPPAASVTLTSFPLDTVSQSRGTVRIMSVVVRSFG